MSDAQQSPQYQARQTPPPGWYNDGSGQQRWWDGTQWSAQFVAPTSARPWNGLAIAGFVVSLAGALGYMLGMGAFIVGLVGGILSAAAYKDVARRGRGFAIAGLIIGVLAMLGAIGYSILLAEVS